jgi:hypothetical protein
MPAIVIITSGRLLSILMKTNLPEIYFFRAGSPAGRYLPAPILPAPYFGKSPTLALTFRARSFKSLVPEKSDMPAMPDAPAASASRKFSELMPPSAITGIEIWLTIIRNA